MIPGLHSSARLASSERVGMCWPCQQAVRELVRVEMLGLSEGDPMESTDRAARVAAAAFAVVLLGVEAVIVAESWRGLTGFAGVIGIHGPAAWGVPVTLDGGSLVAALVAPRPQLAREAARGYPATLFSF